MKPTELRRAGTTLHGARWQRALARDLGVADRTVRRWLRGDSPMPAPAARYIRLLLETRKFDT